MALPTTALPGAGTRTTVWARPDPLDALLGRDVNGSNESQARSASPTLFRLAHKPSTGFTSGASAESYATVNQACWLVSQARIARLVWAGRLSNTRVTGAATVTSRPSAAMIGINCSVSSAPSHRLRRRVAPCDRLEPLKQTS